MRRRFASRIVSVVERCLPFPHLVLYCNVLGGFRAHEGLEPASVAKRGRSRTGCSKAILLCWLPGLHLDELDGGGVGLALAHTGTKQVSARQSIPTRRWASEGAKPQLANPKATSRGYCRGAGELVGQAQLDTIATTLYFALPP